MEVAQQTDTTEQITDKVFKPEIARPASSDLDTRRCEEFEFDPVRGVRGGLHHIVRTEDYPFARQHLRLRRVDHLRQVAFTCGETFDAIKTAPSTFTRKSDAFLAHLVEGEYHPRQQIDRLTDEDQVAGKCIVRRVFKFSSPRWFEDKGVRRKRLTAEERAIVRHRGFKTSGVDTSVGELALCIACLCIADAGDVAECISELAAEGIAFILWEPQRLMDGIGEAVASKAEVLEHGGIWNFASFSHR